MAKRRGAPEPPKQPPELVVPLEEAKARIEERIARGRELRGARIATEAQFEAAKKEYSKWDSFNAELLRRIFSTDELADEYSFWGVSVMSMRPSLGQEIAHHFEDLDSKIHRLDSIVERLPLIPLSPAVKGPGSPAGEIGNSRSGNKVFIVHGHDELAKTSLEVFLREIGLDPVVLHRQADEGLTVIEKFEKHSDVGYAFILLTPDEVSYLRAEEGKPDEQRKKERRARPNVIFEFGYFVGKLGRGRVCCLHTGEVSLPSDVNGMIYKRFSSSIEEVAFGIIKDLKASGYKVTVA